MEPSLINLTVLQSGKGRKRGGAVNAILRQGANPATMPISIGLDLAEELQRVEQLTGGGSSAVLKALKVRFRWIYLRTGTHCSGHFYATAITARSQIWKKAKYRNSRLWSMLFEKEQMWKVVSCCSFLRTKT